jgi:hypothetical protein
LPSGLRVRVIQLLKEQTHYSSKHENRSNYYDMDAFVEYIEKVLTSPDLGAQQKKSMLQDCLARIMPPVESAQLSSLLIILYNQVRPASIDLEVSGTGWLVCPFGPHILPAATMKKHLNLNHFEHMKGYSYENGRLVPLDSASTRIDTPTKPVATKAQAQAQTTSADFSLSPSASTSTSTTTQRHQEQQQQQQAVSRPSYVPTSQVMLSLAARNNPSVGAGRGVGRGRGGATPPPGSPEYSISQSNPFSGPQSFQRHEFSLPPLEFVESQDPPDSQAQTIEG